MAVVTLDTIGKKCPQPIADVSMLGIRKKIFIGDELIVTADCPTFKENVREWCIKTGKTLLYVRDLGDGTVEAKIQW